MTDDLSQRSNRLDAMEENIEWLQENWDDDPSEALKRLALIEGDLTALIGMAHGMGGSESLLDYDRVLPEEGVWDDE